jgi:hypothetical protein
LLAVLALLPWPMIFMLNVLIVVGMYSYSLGNPNLQLPLAGLAVTPLYAGIIYLGHRFKSPVLTIWWLSWTILHLGYNFGISLVSETSLWLISLCGVVFGLGIIYFGRRLWRIRQNGLLFAFALLPIMLTLAQGGLMLIAAVYTDLPPAIYGERDWWTRVISVPFYIGLVSVLFLLPKHHWRWVSLISGAIIYVIVATLIWQSLPFLYMTILWVGLALPIATGLLLEYRYLRHNPFLATG